MLGCYEYDALGTLARRGVVDIEICCVKLPCLHREHVKVEALIGRLGPATTLLMIARRARCRLCRSRGAHVQPSRPASPGTPGHTVGEDVFAWTK